MENTRELMQKSYDLELGHYYSLPMLAWDAVLKKSGTRLDFIKDPTMHCFLESAIRGGYVSTGSVRAVDANNPYLGDEFNSKKPTSYILYIDGEFL